MPLESSSEAARRLLAERRDRVRFHSLPDERAGDMDYAYAVQDELVGLLLASGQDLVAGWKIGLTTKRMQEFCGVSTPVGGAVLKSMIHTSGASLAIGAYYHLGVEAELAVRVARSLPDDVAPNAQNIGTCLDLACAAFEIVDDRDADYAGLDACSLVADNSWNAGIVLGECVAIETAGSLIGRPCLLKCDGEEAGSGATEDAGGDPLEGVAWLATMLRRRGRALEKGQWILTGSIIPTRFDRRPTSYEFTIEGLSTVRMKTTNANLRGL